MVKKDGNMYITLMAGQGQGQDQGQDQDQIMRQRGALQLQMVLFFLSEVLVPLSETSL